MAFLLILVDEFLHLIPNLTWEYIKAYLSPTYKNIMAPHLNDENYLYETYKEEVCVLIEGSKKQLSTRKVLNLPDPPWLDYDKLKRGQEFSKSYYFPICYSNLISLFLLFAHDRSLRSLIYTRKSDTTESAYKRYLSTIHRVKSWYEDDLADPASVARKHIQAVNKYHLCLSLRLNSMTEEQFADKTNLNCDKIESDNDAHKRIQKAVQMSNVQVDTDVAKIIEEGVHVSQCHMAVTQFGFMGLVVLYPEKFGIKEDEDLDCFIHMWQYIGYLLGIEDKYNLCYGTTAQVKRKCIAILEFILKPCMLKVNPSWEHMSLCAFEGINRVFKRLIFETALAFLLYCIDLKFDYFYKTMRLDSKLRFHGKKFLFAYLVPRKMVRAQLNSFIELALENEKYFSE